MKQLCFLFTYSFLLFTQAQDSIFIKVHFLYGSTPKKEFRSTENTWFGGKLGGHVGVEVDSNRIIDFVPSGEFHKFPKKDFHSRFVMHSVPDFWRIFGGNAATVKQATVVIPVSKAQKLKLDSVAKAYMEDTPYDYAFFGMRCGAAAYDILSQVDILPRHSVSRTSRKIFYPKKLRKRLFAKADVEGWKIYRQEGSERRNWERD